MSYISLRRFQRSFRHARHGLTRAIASEHSFRVHVLVAIGLTVFIFLVRLPRIEAALLILMMSSILILELVNTIVERFVDMLEPRVHPYVGLIKDLMAAAVLVSSIAAILIGLLILGPYIW